MMRGLKPPVALFGERQDYSNLTFTEPTARAPAVVDDGG
jgi:hypothetical protein